MMASNPTGKPSTDSTASLVQAIYFDHSDYIPRSSLPPLPAGWHGPWEADGMHVMGNKMYRIMCPAMDYEGAEFLAALLNVTHPSPTKEGE